MSTGSDKNISACHIIESYIRKQFKSRSLFLNGAHERQCLLLILLLQRP